MHPFKMVLLILQLLSIVTVVKCQQCTNIPAAPTSMLVNAMSMANGVFVSGKQGTCCQLSRPEYADVLIVKSIPVDMPMLFPAWVIYHVMEKSSTTLSEQILAFTQEGGWLRVTPYFLKNQPLCHKGPTNTAHLKNLTLDDLIRRKDCAGIFSLRGPNVWIGKWPRCGARVQKNTPSYDSLLSCNVWRLTGLEPTFHYERVPSCGRFPLLPYMLDSPHKFPSPCSDEHKCH